jgi:myo-inositol-1(or 4)-monophosphatase
LIGRLEFSSRPALFFSSAAFTPGIRMQKPAVNVMVKAARQAGNLILRQVSRLESLNVVEKARQDYASEVDSQAEAEIIRELKRAFPTHAFLAEESGAKGKSRFTWVIDPLDGTSNYLRGFPHFCVSIALLEDGEPIHGLVYDPTRNELFTASRGSGAYLNDRRLRMGPRTELDGAVLGTGFAPRERKRIGAQLEAIRHLLQSAEDIRRTGSAALDLAYVACGRMDGYFEAGVKAWDIAAGVLLVREAGGRCCDFDGGSDDLMHGGQIVAGGLKLSEALQKAIVESGYAAAFSEVTLVSSGAG